MVSQFHVIHTVVAALDDPALLLAGGSPVVSVPTADLLEFVQRYYTLNPSVVRYLIGRQLTTKVRKDLDDVADAVGCRIREAWRCFDVLRGVYAELEDDLDSVDAYQAMCRQYCLRPSLAWSYTCLLFLMRHRMNVTTLRRRLERWELSLFLDVAGAMIRVWGMGAVRGTPLRASFRERCSALSGGQAMSSSSSPRAGGAPGSPAATPGGGGTTPGGGNNAGSAAAAAAAAASAPVGTSVSSWLGSSSTSSSGGGGGGGSIGRASFAQSPTASVGRSRTTSVGGGAGGAESWWAAAYQRAATAAPTPSSASPHLAQGGSSPSPPIGLLLLDEPFAAALRESATRLLRGRAERAELCAAVLALFDRANQPPQPGGGGASGGGGGGGGGVALMRRAIDAHLDLFLKGLRDVASSLASTNDFKDVFEGVATKLLDVGCGGGGGGGGMGLRVGDLRVLLCAVACALRGSGAVLGEAAEAVWERYLCVVDFAVARIAAGEA